MSSFRPQEFGSDRRQHPEEAAIPSGWALSGASVPVRVGRHVRAEEKAPRKYLHQQRRGFVTCGPLWSVRRQLEPLKGLSGDTSGQVSKNKIRSSPSPPFSLSLSLPLPPSLSLFPSFPPSLSLSFLEGCRDVEAELHPGIIPFLWPVATLSTRVKDGGNSAGR